MRIKGWMRRRRKNKERRRLSNREDKEGAKKKRGKKVFQSVCVERCVGGGDGRVSIGGEKNRNCPDA